MSHEKNMMKMWYLKKKKNCINYYWLLNNYSARSNNSKCVNDSLSRQLSLCNGHTGLYQEGDLLFISVMGDGYG